MNPFCVSKCSPHVQVGRCAVDLSSALELNALPRLRALSARAAELRLVGLEKVSAKIERLSAAERRQGRRDVELTRVACHR